MSFRHVNFCIWITTTDYALLFIYLYVGLFEILLIPFLNFILKFSYLMQVKSVESNEDNNAPIYVKMYCTFVIN